MRNFYSGISNDRTQFLINMNWYNDNEVETCFSISKNFHGLPEKCSIKKNDFELVYRKLWRGRKTTERARIQRVFMLVRCWLVLSVLASLATRRERR